MRARLSFGCFSRHARSLDSTALASCIGSLADTATPSLLSFSYPALRVRCLAAMAARAPATGSSPTTIGEPRRRDAEGGDGVVGQTLPANGRGGRPSIEMLAMPRSYRLALVATTVVHMHVLSSLNVHLKKKTNTCSNSRCRDPASGTLQAVEHRSLGQWLCARTFRMRLPFRLVFLVRLRAPTPHTGRGHPD